MIKRNHLILVPVLAFVILLLAGLVVSVISLRTVPVQDWKDMADINKILSGKSTKQLTDLLNKNFILSSKFNQIERGINWNLTGDLGPSVRPGCGDWLFLTDELEVYPGREVSAALRADIVASLSDSLNERGIRLLVAVVPDKTRVERDRLCGLRRPEQFEQRISNWLGGVKSRGVETLDLTPALAGKGADNYYHTDTHWNEAGAKLAAFSIASSIAALKSGTMPDFDAVKLSSQRVSRDGDLVHLAGLDGLPAAFRPGVELASITEVEPVVAESDDLFGDAGLPVIALLGTSYSRNSNFAPFLEHYLNEPLANLAKDGGDFSGSALSYISSAGFRDSPAKLLIWEVPERVIEKPVTQAERDWLAKLTKGDL